jgi:hypothetical protein
LGHPELLTKALGEDRRPRDPQVQPGQIHQAHDAPRGRTRRDRRHTQHQAPQIPRVCALPQKPLPRPVGRAASSGLEVFQPVVATPLVWGAMPGPPRNAQCPRGAQTNGDPEAREAISSYIDGWRSTHTSKRTSTGSARRIRSRLAHRSGRLIEQPRAPIPARSRTVVGDGKPGPDDVRLEPIKYRVQGGGWGRQPCQSSARTCSSRSGTPHRRPPLSFVQACFSRGTGSVGYRRLPGASWSSSTLSSVPVMSSTRSGPRPSGKATVVAASMPSATTVASCVDASVVSPWSDTLDRPKWSQRNAD